MTATASMQRRRAFALLAILDTPDLPDALWYVDAGKEMLREAGLTGHLDTCTLDQAHERVTAYARTLGLTVGPDRSVANWTEVSAQGTYMGVLVNVWAAADKAVTR